MTRFCACGCGKSLDGRSSRTRYFDHACAARASRRKLTADLADAGLPTRLNRSLLVAVTVSSTDSHGDSEDRGRSRSGLQTSYRKAVEAAVRTAESWASWPEPREGTPQVMAEFYVAEALPERQRNRLQGGAA